MVLLGLTAFISEHSLFLIYIQYESSSLDNTSLRLKGEKHFKYCHMDKYKCKIKIEEGLLTLSPIISCKESHKGKFLRLAIKLRQTMKITYVPLSGECHIVDTMKEVLLG